MRLRSVKTWTRLLGHIRLKFQKISSQENTHLLGCGFFEMINNLLPVGKERDNLLPDTIPGDPRDLSSIT